jgi:hypothetical protein
MFKKSTANSSNLGASLLVERLVVLQRHQQEPHGVRRLQFQGCSSLSKRIGTSADQIVRVVAEWISDQDEQAHHGPLSASEVKRRFSDAIAPREYAPGPC